MLLLLEWVECVRIVDKEEREIVLSRFCCLATPLIIIISIDWVLLLLLLLFIQICTFIHTYIHVYACTWWENAVSYVRKYDCICVHACICFNSPLEFDAFYIFIPTDFLHTSIHTFSSYCMFFILFVYRLIADVCFVRGCCCCFCQLFNGRICCRFWTFFCWFTRSFKLTLPGPAATHNSLFYASRVIYCLRGQQSYFCYQQILLSSFNSLLAL